MTEEKCCKAEDSKKCGLVCPITGCPVKHVLLTTLIVFAVTFAFDWLFHGIFMKADYEATASLWRSQADMEANAPFCILYHFILALGVSALYCLVAKNSPCAGACSKTGVKFGLLIGLTLGIAHFSSYIWLPIPMLLAVKWLVGSIVWGVLIGFVLSKVRSKLSSCCK